MKPSNAETSCNSIEQEVLDEARELARGAEILPHGATGLARKIASARRGQRQLKVKLGVDPTSCDLHLGHAVVFRKLKRFQDFGHQIILIIGGFTAQIGDPSGRNTTRPPLTAEQVAANAETYLNQMSLILDMSKTRVVNNADWLSTLNLNDILKLSSLVTANQLLAKEAFGSRLEKQLPIGFHELFYPLLQGYDSVAVASDIELGGTDQRFNILQGRELQPHYGQEPQLALLLPLLEGVDGGQKMSKSYNNYIALKDSPDDMFGKCMRIPDELILKYFELATLLPGVEIDQIKSKLAGGGNPKEAKEHLARQIVDQYHGLEASAKAFDNWTRIHSQRLAPQEMSVYAVPKPMSITSLMTASGAAPSTSEAKRLIAGGGVRLDDVRVTDPNQLIDPGKLACPGGQQGSILQVGRRKFIRLVKGS